MKKIYIINKTQINLFFNNKIIKIIKIIFRINLKKNFIILMQKILIILIIMIKMNYKIFCIMRIKMIKIVNINNKEIKYL